MKMSLVVLLFFIAIGGCFADILPNGVQWIVRSDGNDDVIYNGGIIDDLANYTLDGIRHDSLQYSYNYSRRGVLVDVGKVYWNSDETLFYTNLTDDTNVNFPQDQLYVMFIPGSSEGLDLFQYPENCFSQGYYIPWTNFYGSINTQNRSINITHMYYAGNWNTLPVGGYYLFRYLHLPTTLKSWTGEVIGQETEKLVITVHGWNSSGQTYQQDTTFVNLANSIQNKLSNQNSDWKLIAYDWKIDADTGTIYSSTANEIEIKTKSKDLIPIMNGTEAAEIAHVHGQNLAQLILTRCPNIKKVHMIAHSAGSWCARTAINYLIDNTNEAFSVQITLLDPYMPLEGDAGSLLGKQIMEQLANSTNSWKIELLENYYSEDTFIVGTNEQFEWYNYGFNALLSRSVSGVVYDGHNGPIEFFIDSINGSVVYDSDWNNYSVLVDYPDWNWVPEIFGWNLSMPARDMVSTDRWNIDNKQGVDFQDFAILSSRWNNKNCGLSNNWCSNADINYSGQVSLNDLVLLMDNWLK